MNEIVGSGLSKKAIAVDATILAFLLLETFLHACRDLVRDAKKSSNQKEAASGLHTHTTTIYTFFFILVIPAASFLAATTTTTTR